MTTPVAAAIYTRISSDTEGTGLGVARQEEDCRALADRLGWKVAEVYSDNDVSAYSGKRRPAYEQMLSDIAERRIDGVLVYHIDRLTRRPLELEQFLATADAGKLRHVRFVAGDADISTGDGLLVARLLSAVAASESATKSRRVIRKQEQNAAMGLPHKGSMRPFAYEADFVTIRSDEAEVYRQLVARFLAGESARSLATWLNDAEVATVSGKPWISTTVTSMLKNPRYAGLLTRRGQVVGPGIWDPIIDEDTHRRVLSRFAERKTSGRRAPQRYLLSGLCRCSKCGGILYSAARGDTRRYECRSGPDHRGCGKLTVVADPVERLIADMVLYRLDTPELADALHGRSSADARAGELSQTYEQTRLQLEELATAYANRDISMGEWMTAKRPIQDRLEQAERQLARLTRSTVLVGLVGNGAELRSAWAGLNLDRQHAIVKAVIDHVQIGPGTPGAARFDPGRVTPIWRH